MSLPAYLQNLPSRNLAQTAISNVGQGNPPYLSIEGSRFTLVDVAGNTIPIQTLYIDVVIVDMNEHMSQTYFDPAVPFDPNNPVAPLCFSDNGIGPSTMAREPQSVACNGCPKQTWEKINTLGNKVPWCQKSQKIAIWPFEHSDGIFLLKIPPASAFDSWRGYMAKFASANLEPDRVITRISFTGTGTLGFQSPGYITEQMVGPIAKMVEAKAADAIIGRLDKPRTGALPAPSVYVQNADPRLQPVVGVPQPQVANGPLPVPPAAPQLTAPTPPASQPFPSPSTTQPPPATPTPFPGGTAATAFPSSPPAQPVQRRRRTKAEMAQARAQEPPAQAPAPAQPQQAPFRPDPAPNAMAQPNPGIANQQAQFGIVQNPPAPPPGLDLDAVFK